VRERNQFIGGHKKWVKEAWKNGLLTNL
jgi:hypothetical protein